MKDAAPAFSDIYDKHTWGSDSKSGPGSTLANTHEYVTAVQRFLAEREIKSVVDVGCGDWSTGGQIDLTGIDYVGVDVVPQLVETLNASHGRPGVRFDCIDATREQLPSADLLLIKDVLQHWPASNVRQFLQGLDGFRFALITNDYAHYERWRRFRLFPYWQDRTAKYEDAEFGGYKPLSLLEPPFSLSAERLLDYEVVEGGYMWRIEVLLWKRGS